MVRKKIAYILGLIALLSICFLCFHSFFSFKDGDGSYVMKTFYELEEDSVDVLILGTSHAFEGINPAILWDDLGITAYDLCGSKATMWNSYYYLEEALKTQTPQLVILDAFSLVPTFEDDGDVVKYIKNTAGLKPSSTKYRALKATAEEDWLSYALEYMQYHNRYSDLSDSDFYPYRNDEPQFKNWLGFGCNYHILHFDNIPLENHYLYLDLVEKEEEYYRKIIELCSEKEIPLLILTVPYGGYSGIDMSFLNAGAMIAEELGVPFVDFNLYRDSIGLETSTDFADFNHLSYVGSERFSHYLAKFLESNYSFIAHDKMDIRYARWNQAYAYFIRNQFNHDISRIDEVDTIWEMLYTLPESYEVIISIPGQDAQEYSKNVNDVTVNGDEKAIAPECTEVWLLQSGKATQLFETKYGYYYKKQLGHNELVVDEQSMFWKKKEIPFPEKAGTRVLVFDTTNQCVVDAVVIEKNVIYRVTEE